MGSTVSSPATGPAISDPALTLVALRPDHASQAMALSAALGWPYREDDWRFAIALGRGVAVETRSQLTATALWWAYENAFASFGMIIVTPALQGRGIGRLLTDTLLRQTGERSIILNATREGIRLYERLGFLAYGQVHQHQAVLAAAPRTAQVDGIRPYHAKDLVAIRDLDRRATGMGRTALLDALFGLGTVMVIERGGLVQGYACLRRFGRGVVIGPVVAPGTADAKALIAALAAPHAGSFVRIDVTEASALSPWLEEIGLPCVDRVVSMARGPRPTGTAAAMLFALSNQSFG
jgi:GNAT superfamily N-acetyltransferase